jgi:hypothetical protein
MEVRVNDDDLRRVIQQMAIEKANDQATIAALSRTITEMEMAQAAEAEAEEKPQKTKKDK